MKGRQHQTLDRLLRRHAPVEMARPEAKGVRLVEERRKEGQAADMVEMRVRQEDVRIEPRRGQMIALAHVPPVLTHCVHGEVYLTPRPSGELLIGATVERAGFMRAVPAEGIAGLLQAAFELVPSLRGLSIARTWCGFRPWAPDSLPVLGPWPGVEGLFVATGHFRNGILLAPITARLMTDWIAGKEPSLPVKDFLPDRFARRSRTANHFLNNCCAFFSRAVFQTASIQQESISRLEPFGKGFIDIADIY